MARKLKTYQTSLGFFDLAIAAPSMKAALEAWGADSNLFHQGAAKESKDPDVVAATMAKPGVVLKRPVGSDGPFTEHADRPAKQTTRHPARPPWNMRSRRSDGSSSANSKRPPGRRNASAASKPSTRRNPPGTRNVRGYGRHRLGCGARKFFASPLKPKSGFFIFQSPSRDGSWAPHGPGKPEMGTGRVRCRSYPF